MLLTVTRYPDDEPCTWPVVVSESGNLLAALGHTDRGTHDGTTSFRGVEYTLRQCSHAPHWTQLVPVRVARPMDAADRGRTPESTRAVTLVTEYDGELHGQLDNGAWVPLSGPDAWQAR